MVTVDRKRYTMTTIDLRREEISIEHNIDADDDSRHLINFSVKSTINGFRLPNMCNGQTPLRLSRRPNMSETQSILRFNLVGRPTQKLTCCKTRDSVEHRSLL